MGCGDPHLWVGGVLMEDGDYLAIRGTSTTTVAQEDNYAHYSNGVLYLHNYKYSGLSYVNMIMNNQALAGENLVYTAKALFAYNKLAESYFNN